MIIQDENGGGGETVRNEGLRRAPVRRGRDRYGTRPGVTRRAAIRGEQRTGTRANCTDDVIEKN